jgi:hypothetical protein
MFYLPPSQASRFFVEARRSGLIEVLAAPLGGEEIVQGQRRAAFVRYAGDSPLCILGHGAFATLLVAGNGGAVPDQMLPGGGGLWATPRRQTVTCWFGMDKNDFKSANLATLKTLFRSPPLVRFRSRHRWVVDAGDDAGITKAAHQPDGLVSILY